MLDSIDYFKICKNKGRGVAASSMHEVLESTKTNPGILWVFDAYKVEDSGKYKEEPIANDL